MSSPATVLSQYPGRLIAAADRAGPVSTQATTVVEITIAIQASPEGVDRIRALIDRLTAITAYDDCIEPEVVLHPGQRTAQLDGRPLTLTRREYDLLLFLARNPHQAFTRNQLLRQVWDIDVDYSGRTVDVHVRRLRAKLDGRGPIIHTIRGLGYRLDRTERLRIAQG